jgi:hypothetical protein
MEWVLELNKWLKVFGFLNFYFVGLGWFVVCVHVAFFFASSLHYNGQSSIIN